MIKPLGRPRKRLAMRLIGASAIAAIVLFLLVYFVLFPTSSPKPFKLTPATTAAASNSTSSTAAPSTTSSSTASTQVGGSWKISSGSQAGYRVREKLAFLPAQSDAVGRTSQISGAATLAESAGIVKISSATFQVAVNTLKSDRSMRDEKVHSIGLESDRFPTATFVLATPISVSSKAIKGHVAHLAIIGTFTIHGVAKKETVPVEMSLSGATLEAAGALTFPWSEFGMTAPSVGGFVNVTEKATMEFDLRLLRS
jgi:polyisoprenoid-binding protein YceI